MNEEGIRPVLFPTALCHCWFVTEGSLLRQVQEENWQETNFSNNNPCRLKKQKKATISLTE